MTKILTAKDFTENTRYKYRNDWIRFYPKKGFRLEFSPASYFDPRWNFDIQLGWGKISIHLPIDSGIEKADPPQYGVYWYENALWFMLGERCKSFDMPWAVSFYRRSMLRKDGNWENEMYNDKKWFYEEKWKDVLFAEEYPYTYVLQDGTKQTCTATVQVKEMEWRWKWFKRFSFSSQKRKSIDVQFSAEVGEEAGSWKGGCIGCSYEMLENETPYQTLVRMEKERKFD